MKPFFKSAQQNTKKLLPSFRSRSPAGSVTVQECPTPLAPITTRSKKFVEVKTKNAQHDLIVLHVAYILQKSSNLQSLILEIVRLSENHAFEDIIHNCVGFTARLIAALDSPRIAKTGVEQAIVMLLKTIKSVDWNARDEASFKIKASIKEIKDAYPDISTIEQKKDSNFSKVSSKVLGVALPMLDIIKTGSSMIPVPMVQPLIGVVAGFLHAADQACNNFEWIRWLSTTAAECVIGIVMHCPEQTEQTKQSEWTKAIETLQRKLADIVQRAEDFCRRSVVSRFLQQGCDKGTIETMKEDLRAAISNFYLQVGMNIKLDLERMSRKIDGLSLTSLPHLKFSDRDPYDDRFQASREKEIEDTLRWIEGSDGMRFFWIYGAAGVGKSTLARRLLDHIMGEGILATFAYFSLGNTIDPKDLVRGMARELSSLHPGCRPAVARAISECSGEHQGLDEYLTHFLVKPVDSLAYGGSLVIILDALDEWPIVYRRQFLKALRKLPHTLSLKFVMTSRYLEDIASIVDDAAIRYELNPVSDPVCRKYFEERFNDPEWDGPRPDDNNLDKLVELAGGFLIWAATVCTLVSTPHPDKPPSKTLEEILSSSLILGREERMEDLYREALERIFPAKYKESCLKLSLSMMVLREDLPLIEFSRLVGMTPQFIQDICRRLRALQTRGKFYDSTVQPAVKLFHASFIQHLGRLNEAHGVMADNCIHFFKRVTELHEPGPFPFRKTEQYIGKHWMYHLQEAPEKRSNFLNVPSNHLRLWAGCLLSHLFLLGDMYGYSPGSDALKSLSDRLVSTEGILSTPEMLWCDRSTTEMVFLQFQKALELGGIDYKNAKFYTDNPKDVQHWVHVLNGLAITTEQIQRLSANPNTENLNVAIDILKNLNAYTPDILDKPFLLDNLGLALCTRSRLSSSLEDLTTAISLHVKARDLRPKNSHDYPISLSNLASTLLIRFKYGSHSDDLSQAISLFSEVLELWPVSHHLRSMSLCNLGNALLTQFEHGGQRVCLEVAILLHRCAVESTSSGHAGLPSFLNNLGNSYLFHSKHTGDLQDINCAIFHHQNAVKSTPSSHSDLPRFFNSLGRSYLARYKHTGDLQDIDSAIFYHLNTVASTPSNHADRPSFFNSLGNSYLSRFKCSSDLRDINYAISYHQNAVKSTPSGHADLPSFFNSLRNSYSCRHIWSPLTFLSHHATGRYGSAHRRPESHGHFRVSSQIVLLLIPSSSTSSSHLFHATQAGIVWGSAHQPRSPISKFRVMVSDTPTLLKIFTASSTSSLEDSDATRESVSWIGDPPRTSNVQWFNDPAGAGKTAIAQSLCTLMMCGRTTRTFFFSQYATASGRSNTKFLFPTISESYGLSVPKVGKINDEVIANDPSIPKKALEIQLQKLILGPPRHFSVELMQQLEVLEESKQQVSEESKQPIVIILDGLDEGDILCLGSVLLRPFVGLNVS